MPLKVAFRTFRYVSMIAVMFFIWALLAMVYFERFVPPLDRLSGWLLPWKRLYSIPPEADILDRIRYMEGILRDSEIMGDMAFVIMVVSFVAFSSYLVLVYQQRQRRVNENRLLLIKNREIARRNEFIRYISATIGHEFKNNLGRIKRRIHLIDLPPEVRKRLDVNLGKLFADIEIFKKISDEREAGLVEFQPVTLKDMLLSLSRQYSDLADFEFKGGTAASTTIYVSPALLVTVLENIIDNAIKYKKPEQQRAKIAFSCSMDSDGPRRYVSLSVRDEGVGMDEEMADACFYTGRESESGWGQGLYYAKYVVGLHAGKIRVGKEYTSPGVGTEIIMNLPYVEETIHV